MQSQILRPNFTSLATLAFMLVAAAFLAVALLATHLPVAIVTSPAVAPTAPTVQHYVEPDAADRSEPMVQPALAIDTNPDNYLPICRRHGGPAC